MPKTSHDVCDIFSFNEEKVAHLTQEIKGIGQLAPLFKALADPTRLKIVYALSLDELCVCDVATIIGSTVATASHHLRLLSSSGVARSRREGKMVFYSLADLCVATILETARRHQVHNESHS
ncbi:MAG: metalloregulator ArsR/SmtB family transcription factor [Desulfotomaculaceae bacterium]|nr:metalloregulator ArsR/SmtB family transcription factor [Desulfotomaculaceae bacterium]